MVDAHAHAQAQYSIFFFSFLSFYKERYTLEYVKLSAGFGGSTCVYIFIFFSMFFFIFESLNVLYFSYLFIFFIKKGILRGICKVECRLWWKHMCVGGSIFPGATLGE